MSLSRDVSTLRFSFLRSFTLFYTLKCRFQIFYDIIDMFRSNGKTDRIRPDPLLFHNVRFQRISARTPTAVFALCSDIVSFHGIGERNRFYLLPPTD